MSWNDPCMDCGEPRYACSCPVTELNIMKHDPVNHPSHYTDGKIEVVVFIEDKKLGFHRGNAVKYICRAGKKDPAKEVEDLEKAVWYLQREIENLKETQQS